MAQTDFPAPDEEDLEFEEGAARALLGAGAGSVADDDIIDLREAPSSPAIARSAPALPQVAAPIRPSRRGWFVALVVAIALALIAYLVMTSLGAAPLAGLSAEVVNPGEVSLSFPASGVLSAVDVHAGERVGAGTVLATETVPGLSEARTADEAAVTADTQQIATLKSLIAQVEGQTQAASSNAVQAASSEVAAARQALQSDEAALATAQAEAAQTAGAASALLASDEVAEASACAGIGAPANPPTAAQLACADAEHRVAADELALAEAKANGQATVTSIQDVITADQRTLADAQAQVSIAGGQSAQALTSLQASLAAAEAELARDQGSLAGAAATAASQVLRAPISGTVVSVDGAPGETVSAGGVADQAPSGASIAVTPGFTLFPSTQTVSGQALAATPVVVIKGQAPTYAEILVPEGAIGQVRIGDAVSFAPAEQGLAPVQGVVQQIFPRPVVAAGVVSYEVQARLVGRIPANLLTGVTGKATIHATSRR